MKSTGEKERNNLIDVLKILGSLIVVMAHSGGFDVVAGTLGPLVVPFFMLVTSYYLFINDAVDFKKVKKMVKRLWSLWLFWMIMYTPFTLFILWKKHTFLDIRNQIISIVIIGKPDAAGQLWYLYCLAFGILIVYTLLKHKAMLLGLILLLVGIYIWFIYFNLGGNGGDVHSPLINDLISAPITGIIWPGIGLLIAKNNELIKIIPKQYLKVGTVVFICVIFMLYFLGLGGNFVAKVCLTVGQIFGFVIVFLWILRTNLNIDRQLANQCAKYSALIYFIHAGVIDCLKFIGFNSGVTLYIATIIVTLGASYIYMRLARRTTFKILNKGI